MGRTNTGTNVPLNASLNPHVKILWADGYLQEPFVTGFALKSALAKMVLFGMMDNVLARYYVRLMIAQVHIPSFDVLL